MLIKIDNGKIKIVNGNINTHSKTIKGGASLEGITANIKNGYAIPMKEFKNFAIKKKNIRLKF